MNRRGFFQRTIGALVAAVYAPSAQARQLPLLFRAYNTTSSRLHVYEGPPVPVRVGAINKATFKFWRNQDGPMRPLTQADTDAFRRRICEVYEECK